MSLESVERIERRVGSTTGFEFVLEDAGTPRDLSNANVSLFRKSSKGEIVRFDAGSDDGVVEITDAQAGEISISPGSDFFEDGVKAYYLYFRVTEDEAVSYYPPTKNIKIDVKPRFKGG